MDIEYLKYLAKSKNLKIYELGEKMGLTRHYFYRKLKDEIWDIADVKKVKAILEMTDDDVRKVFGI